ncbi:MAG: HAD family phosphatase [Muribaculaceae bacterium]|nr:HAD family phosphatase [Muribaculaceae bacterium]
MTQETGMLFDLDGVLVDSEGEYSVFWGSIGDRYNMGPDFKDRIKGTTLTEILDHFPEEDREGIKAELYNFEGKMDYVVYPGVREFLEDLTRRGIPTAIVTSSDDAKMEKLFARRPELRHAATKIVTADMVTHSKPDPEGYILGTGLIGVPVEKCFVFEDSINGLLAARASGATVVGIATTNPAATVTELSDISVDHFSELSVDMLLEFRKIRL